MSARAIWKGVIDLADSVPVKLYSAQQSQRVSFRLLSRDDGTPVKQVLVNPETGELVDYGAAGRGHVSDGRLTVLHKDELEAIQPEPSRQIEMLSFVPEGAIDFRWFDRPYRLGPDEDADAWSALSAALARTELTGIARWVMRNRLYYGALKLHSGMPMLITLRTHEEVLPLDDTDLRDDSDLDKKQLAMARQLIEMLAGDFEPESLVDDYRESVLELIERKKQGQQIVRPERTGEPAAAADLSAALTESLKRGEARA